VVGPEAEYDVIREHAGARLYMTRNLPREARPLGGGFFELDVTTPIRQYRDLRPALAGRHQLDNVITAIRAAECLKLSREQIERGVNCAVWPGRLERITGSPVFLLDGAHNVAAMQALCATLEEFYSEGVPMIFGCMADKDYEAMLTLLRPRVREMVFTRVTGTRSKDPEELLALWPGAHVAASPRDAIACARDHFRAGDTVVVCGSLYLIGEVRSMLESEVHGGHS
jgi:dihydrofolate synthase/folylpolyglutamate synthase